MDGVWLLVAGVSLLVFFLLILAVGVGLVLYTRKTRRAAAQQAPAELVALQPEAPAIPPVSDHFGQPVQPQFAPLAAELSPASAYMPEAIAPLPHSEAEPITSQIPPDTQHQSSASPFAATPHTGEPPVEAPLPAPPAMPRETAEMSPDAAVPPVSQSWGNLVGISGAVEGRTIPIDERGFYVGRDGAVSQVVIENPRISKRHVWIGVRSNGVVAVDQGSTNGTYLNRIGARITEAPLQPGDTIILADDAARFRYQY